MYTYQSLQDVLFLMLYGGVAMLAFVAAFYLLFRRNNAFSVDIITPKALRKWTAAFFIIAALSHCWWFALGVYWLTDDRMVRNITAVTLDHIMLVPLVMAMLLRMLQDRHHRLWPWFLAQVPTAMIAVVGITMPNVDTLDIIHYWQVTVIATFVVYYVYVLLRYGRWLRDNYADLEHKEVWQSLLFVVVLFIIYEIYSTNPGVMSREYIAQYNTIFIVAFLLWRVETLQELEVKEDVSTPYIQEELLPSEPQDSENADGITPLSSNIGLLLQKYCVESKLYLQHDLTLTQLSEKLGTNRTYLSQYFSQQDITYNLYVNRLRIDHFERLYREAIVSGRFFTAQQLAHDSGFRSYSTFAAAFKQFMGQTVTEWMRQQN